MIIDRTVLSVSSLYLFIFNPESTRRKGKIPAKASLNLFILAN